MKQASLIPFIGIVFLFNDIDNPFIAFWVIAWHSLYLSFVFWAIGLL